MQNDKNGEPRILSIERVVVSAEDGSCRVFLSDGSELGLLKDVNVRACVHGVPEVDLVALMLRST